MAEIALDTIVHANQLRNNSLQKRALKENIVAILRRIDDELRVAHREGKHEIMTTIPITFDIPNMNNKNSQRTIWASVINELLKREFRVWINPDDKYCKLKITWMSKEDSDLIKLQTDMIAKHTAQF